MNWDTLTTAVAVASLGDYTACEITVTYRKRRCIEDRQGCPPLVTNQVEFFKVVWDWDECGAAGGLLAFLYPGYPDDFGTLSETNWRQFIEDVQAAVGRYHFEIFYDGLDEEEKEDYQCDGGFPDPCEMPNCLNYAAFFTNPRCIAICEERADGKITQLLIPCSDVDKSCCFHTRTYCYCTDGEGYVMSSETTSSTEVDCSEATKPSSSYCTEYGNPDHPTNDYRVFRDCAASCDD